MNNKVRRLKDGTYEWSNNGGESWEQCTPEEFEDYLRAGAEDLTDLDEEDDVDNPNLITCEVDLNPKVDDKITALELTPDGLKFTFSKQGQEVHPTYADELYFTWFKDAIARNTLDMAAKLYFDIVDAKKRDEDVEPVSKEDFLKWYDGAHEDDNKKLDRIHNIFKTNGLDSEESIDVAYDKLGKAEKISITKIMNEAEEEEDEEIVVDDETDPAPEDEDAPEDEEIVLNTVKDVYNYASNKDNKLDSTFVELLAKSEGNVETLGGQSFRIHEVQLPLEEEDEVYCRFLVGQLDGQDDGVFVCIPNTWQTVASLEEVDYEKVNEDTPCNAIVSESLVIEDPDNFYKELGDLYASGPAYMPKEDVELPDTLPDDNDNADETPAEDIPPEGEPASISDFEASDEISFESTLTYLPKASEKWLKEFTASESFLDKCKAYLKNLNESLRSSIRKYVFAILSEDKNFIAIRVDKSGILESSLTTAWFKKRLTKACEAVKKVGPDLRIVETRGSYYTRTFFLVEATNKNYCISEDEVLEEISINGSDILLESKKASLTEEALTKLNELFNNDDHIVIKPTLKDKSGAVIESFDVDNDDKRPYIIRMNEDAPKIVLVPQELVPIYLEPGSTLDVMTPDGVVPVEANNAEPAPEQLPPAEPKPGNEEPAAPADSVAAPATPEEPLNDETQASDIAPKTGPVFGDSGLILLKPEELEETLQKLFDERCVHESDFINGFQTSVLPVEIDRGDLGHEKAVYCDLYGDMCKATPYSDNGIPSVSVTDLKGKPLYFSPELNKFLTSLLFKYL